MQLQEHPEYQTVYEPIAPALAACQAAVAHWLTTGATITVEQYELTWTPLGARQFVTELAGLFQHYNEVLWQHFAYCSQCGGQCCVVAASDVRLFDLLAVTLLDEAAPRLPERIATNRHDCIYLNGQQCSWPARWRTIKCWSFYCLGSGPWLSTTPLSELYRAVTQELEAVVNEHLPVPLRSYEATHNVKLSALLDDPVGFASVLHGALEQLLVQPVLRHYPDLAQKAGPYLAPQPPTADPTRQRIELYVADLHVADAGSSANGLEIIAALSDVVLEMVEPGAEDLLAELETLAWIVENNPTQARTLSATLLQRYGESPALLAPEGVALWGQLHTTLQCLP